MCIYWGIGEMVCMVLALFTQPIFSLDAELFFEALDNHWYHLMSKSFLLSPSIIPLAILFLLNFSSNLV